MLLISSGYSAYARHLARTFVDWDADRLAERVRRITSYLDESTSSSGGVARLVYVHCEGGVDRTGELIGAVELTRGGDWPSVVRRALNAATPSRLLSRRNFNALHWFCHYWRETQPDARLDCSLTQTDLLNVE